MKCIATVTSSINVNGKPEGKIVPTHGLRLGQGDPLSPHLLILCIEALSSPVHAARNENMLEGIQMIRNCPKIYRLFFADDSLLFIRVSLNEAAFYKELIKRY